MKVAHLDCASGISGDMMLGALVDVGVPLEAMQAGIESIGLSNCRFEAEQVKRKGFRATKVHVHHEPEHAHRHLHDIVAMIESGSLNETQQHLAKTIFERIGAAEAFVHGTTIEKVHFHEVGAVDSIADIVGTAIGWNLLGPPRLTCSPIPTGQGYIQIAHGRVSVPAPATAELLKGVPLAPCQIESELTTPTGAAIVTTLATSFQHMPAISIDRIGYGAGDRDLAEQGNIVRLYVGTSTDQDAADRVTLLETNLDDVTGEIIGHCTARLMTAGALDVYTTAIHMKKNRPGIKLSVVCDESQRPALEEIIFSETSSLGIRRWTTERSKLPRATHQVETAWGLVSGKRIEMGERVWFSPEYDACQQVATQHGVPLAEVFRAARNAFRQ